ncbi:MAG TPA: aminotransferase, partial [Syntrophobacteraceae bacterium]|nr:aminotransferase [Syntrophobacteraceae bacterium]HBD08650.1 aminotransferase [Syntrophobacteraceae bacterium]HBZ54094.1 aminotransferase [Syntrophobacteraceae bacterium]
MRTDIVHMGAGELKYEIRNIIRVADKLQQLGVKVNLENIGDPVAKGEKIPVWMKQIVADLAMQDVSYGYCPTQGMLETREFLAVQNNRNGGVHISANDIIFFNGLGEAITKIYGFLRSTARVITPSPTYTTHSASEAAHAGQPPVSYPLDPHNHWFPDIGKLHRRVKYNPSVAGILLINPDNPTGAVYPEDLLREIVDIAREFDLFIIADEIYQNLIFNGQKTKPLADVIGDVPGLAMKGISKELPWPGSRCGWIEVYNADKDADFARYIQSILNAKMVEVCSTTLPQRAIPHIFQHSAYQNYLEKRRRRYERFSNLAYERLGNIPGVLANRTNGAFYMSVAFEDGLLNGRQTLPVANHEAKTLVQELTLDPTMQPDKRFVYYLLAATGICVVPLTSFNTDWQGFRMT